MGSVSGRECAGEDMHVVEQVLHERLALVVNYRNKFPRMPTGQPGGGPGQPGAGTGQPGAGPGQPGVGPKSEQRKNLGTR